MTCESFSPMDFAMHSDSSYVANTKLTDVQGTVLSEHDILFNVLEPNEPRLIAKRKPDEDGFCFEGVDIDSAYIKERNLVVLGNFDMFPELYP